VPAQPQHNLPRKVHYYSQLHPTIQTREPKTEIVRKRAQLTRFTRKFHTVLENVVEP
jgi:hypothetical protein